MNRYRPDTLLSENLFQDRRILLWIVITAIALRVMWALLVPTVPVSDSLAYDAFARNLAEHGVYGWTPEQPSAYWPVGTSALYAPLFMLFGHQYWPIVVLNIVLSVVIIVAAFRIARRLPQIHSSVPLIAAAVLALWPGLIMYVTVLASELPFIASVMVAVDFWTQAKRPAFLRGVVSGIFLAAACYIKPTAQLLPLVLALSALFAGQSLRTVLVLTASAYIAIIVLIAPWILRNYRIFDAFVVISTNAGANLWMGNHPGSAGGYNELPESVKGMDEVSRDHVLGDEARKHIMSDIPGYIMLSGKRLVDTYDRETIPVVWNEQGIDQTLGPAAKFPLKLVASGYWIAVLLLAIMGSWIVYAGSRRVSSLLGNPLFLLWGYFALVHALIVSQDRYHFPSIPSVAVLAAIALHFIYSRWVKQN